MWGNRLPGGRPYALVTNGNVHQLAGHLRRRFSQGSLLYPVVFASSMATHNCPTATPARHHHAIAVRVLMRASTSLPRRTNRASPSRAAETLRRDAACIPTDTTHTVEPAEQAPDTVPDTVAGSPPEINLLHLVCMQNLAYTAPMQARETTFISKALIFKALMHPTRIALLEALREGEQCVCRLEEALDMPQAYISQQLAVLRRVGLVADQRRGLNIFYRIIKPEVLQMIDLACAIVGDDVHHVPTGTLSACGCARSSRRPSSVLDSTD